MKKFAITVNIEFEAATRTLAENEAKRIYGGVDDLVAEQNDPKTTTISLSLINDADRLVLRTITTSKARVK